MRGSRFNKEWPCLTMAWYPTLSLQSSFHGRHGGSQTDLLKHREEAPTADCKDQQDGVCMSIASV